ncbi:amidohydrolase [Peribacillus muralis]|uniref:Amidohydrolase n=1 Tax=Peribacillus muralis TaxID=264697 RepID=A0A1B3XSB3_9BACI|nr:amidohydrolase [Peribacillus muralis]AOH56104.1 amidohydrolase [Peribacillus muralis]
MGTLWFNGSIYTMIKEGDRVEALFSENGVIADTGNSIYLRQKYAGNISREIDLKGQTMLPGLVDSHLHLVGHGERLLRLDLSLMKGREAILNVLKAKCAVTPPGKWIVAEGWNENEWSVPELILRDELDAISTEHPIVLKRICRHALVVNSGALLAADIKEEAEEPAGGVICRYPDGRLNGLFKESQAQNMILDSLPGIDQDYIEAALSEAIADAHKLGLTGGHTEDLHYYNGFEPTYEAFKSVIEDKGMAFRANLLVHHEALEDMRAAGGRYQEGTRYIKFDSMKLFTDGSLGGHTALLSEPYADQSGTNGVAIFTEAELHQWVQKARQAGMPIAAHAIGDLAFEYVLDAIEAFPPKLGLRDRLIHAQIVRPELLERAAVLPVIFDIQPGFVPSDFPWVEEKVPAKLLASSYAWKTYLRMGIICAGGSDAPIEPLNPLLGIHAAVTRAKIDSDEAGYGLAERLTVYEAFSLYTKGSAAAIGQEKRRGMISKGYDADFTVFDQDVFTGKPEALPGAEAVMTVIDDRIMFDKNNSCKRSNPNAK